MKKFVTVMIVSLVAVALAAQTNTGVGASASGAAQSSTATQAPPETGQGTAMQTSTATTGDAQAQAASLAAGTQIQAVLTKGVDAKKAQVGDEVNAKVRKDVKDASGNVVLPKNSKLFGRVTNVQVKGKGEANQNSAIAILFDRAMLKNGSEMRVNMLISSAVAPVPASAAADMSGDTYGGGSPSGGAPAPGGSTVGAAAGTVGGVASGVGNTVGTVGSTVGNTTAGAAGTTTGAVAGGVAGIPNVAINTAASNTTNGTVFVGKGENVRLHSGTELVLQVAAK